MQNVANCFCISMALWYILCTKFSSLCKFLRQFGAKKFTPEEALGRGRKEKIMKKKTPQENTYFCMFQTLPYYIEKVAENRRRAESQEKVSTKNIQQVCFLPWKYSLICRKTRIKKPKTDFREVLPENIEQFGLRQCQNQDQFELQPLVADLAQSWSSKTSLGMNIWGGIHGYDYIRNEFTKTWFYHPKHPSKMRIWDVLFMSSGYGP